MKQDFGSETSRDLVLKTLGNIKRCNIDDIVNVFFTIRNKEKPEIKPENTISGYELNNILSRVNELPSIDLRQINLLLNLLSDLKYKKSDLSLLDFNKITGIINEKAKSSDVEDVIKSFNALSRLRFDKQELNLDVENISNQIKINSGIINDKNKIIALHAFAQMGYVSEEGIIGKTTDTLVKNLIKNNKLLEIDSKGVATLVHSLAVMGSFSNLKEITEYQSLLTEEKILELSPESAFSLLQTQMIYDLYDCGTLFDQERLQKICNKSAKSDNAISNLQKSVARSLIKSQTNLETNIYQINDIKLRNIDISYHFEVIDEKTGEKTLNVFFVEVDGPTHFCQQGKELVTNSATKRRDLINTKSIQRFASKQDGNTKCYYLTISDKEIKDFLTQGGNLTDFLDYKLTEIQKQKPIAENNQKKNTKEIETSSIEIESENVPKEKSDVSGNSDNKITSTLKNKPNNQRDKLCKKIKRNTQELKKQELKEQEEKTNLMILRNAVGNNKNNVVKSLIVDGLDLEKIVPDTNLSGLNYILNNKTLSADVDIVNLLVKMFGGEILSGFNEKDTKLLLEKAIENNKIPTICSIIENCPISETEKQNLEQKLIEKALFLKSPKLLEIAIDKGFIRTQSGNLEKIISDYLVPHIKSQSNDNNEYAIKMFDFLVKKGADIKNVKFFNNFDNQLSIASFLLDLLTTDHEQTFLNLVKHNDNFNLFLHSHEEDNIGACILAAAAENNKVEVLRHLISEKGMNKDSVFMNLNLATRASRFGAVDSLKFLLDLGLDTNEKNIVNSKSCGTPLDHAISEGRTAAVKLLLERGANPNIESPSPVFCKGRKLEANISPLFFAIERNFPEIVELLVKNPTTNLKTIRQFDGAEVLSLSVIKNNPKLIDALSIRKDDFRASEKNAAFLIACSSNLPDMVDKMIEKFEINPSGPLYYNYKLVDFSKTSPGIRGTIEAADVARNNPQIMDILKYYNAVAEKPSGVIEEILEIMNPKNESPKNKSGCVIS